MFLFFHFLYSNVPNNNCHKQKWRVSFFARIKLVTRVCACDRAHQMDKTEMGMEKSVFTDFTYLELNYYLEHNSHLLKFFFFFSQEESEGSR